MPTVDEVVGKLSGKSVSDGVLTFGTTTKKRSLK
jgi:hypothetical protein